MNSHNKNNTTRGQRNPAEYLILGALAGGPLHGYDLYRYLEEQLGWIWTLGRSQTYALLSRMEQAGLVSHERQAQEKRPDRKIFTPSPEGKKTFKHWVNQPVLHVRDLRLEFLAKLHFTRVLGKGAEGRLVNAQVALLEKMSSGMEDKIRSAKNFVERQALQFRLAQTQAALGWLQSISIKEGE
jgi:DNA-binding PadR family transcriptional regulator